MGLGGGDQLAKGAPRANFSQGNVSEDKWKDIFGEEGLRKLNAMDEKERQRLMDEAEAKVKEIESAEKPVSDVTVRAVRDRVWVTRFDEPDQKNGLYLPDEGKEKPAKGIVVAVGPGVWVNGNLQSLSVNVGDKVMFGKFAGAEVQVGLEHYLVIREEDIFGIEEKKEK